MGASAATESQIRVLIDAVDRADREGNRREAERALAQARAAAADDPRVHKARLFERQAKRKQAAYMYHAFLCCVPPGVPQPPAVQSAVEHANEVLRENDAALETFLRPRVSEARARHAGARLERFDACFDSLIGKRRVFAPQPTFMLFPRLPAIEFLDREDFRWLDAFEAAADEIRAEARAALAQAADDFVPYISKPAGSPVDQWQERNNSKRRSTFS